MTSQKELIPMRPGDILRYERKQKGMSIESASRQSRIKSSVLIAIESGETSEIPSVYLRGYIRNYARFLGVDPADLEDKMENVQGAEPEVRSVFSAKSNLGKAEKWFKASSYLAASALIAALAWQFTHEAVRFSQGDAQKTAETVRPEAGESGLDESISPAQRATNKHVNASIASVEMLKQGSEPGAESTAEQAGTGIGDEADSAQMHRLSVATSADTWIEILDARGQSLELDLIRAGNRRQYNGQAPFRIMIGRASAVVLTMDGEIIDLGPYTRDNVARMTLGAELAADTGQQTDTENR
jgi:cytoskeleton protein RodZ